jgi:release factor glutamine methyltransferase
MHYDPSQVYQPEADTYLLLDAARAAVRPGMRVLEVGTGSGLVAAAMQEAGARTLAVDINPHAAACARQAGVDTVRCDLLEAIGGQFDLILFNPPYLPTEPHERIDDWLEYALDGGADGRAVIGRFAAQVGRLCAPGGRILLLISSLTGLSETKALFGEYGYSVDVIRQEPVEDEVLYVLRIQR